MWDGTVGLKWATKCKEAANCCPTNPNADPANQVRSHPTFCISP